MKLWILNLKGHIPVLTFQQLRICQRVNLVNTYDGKMYMRDGSSNIVTVGSHYTTDFESTTKTFYVTVASSATDHVHHGSGSSNKYKINGVFSPYLKLIPGITYRFDQSDSSNSGHPFRFYLDENKNTSYTTGVTTNGTTWFFWCIHRNCCITFNPTCSSLSMFCTHPYGLGSVC